MPGSGKLAFILQYLAEGVGHGERVALLSGYEPAEVFEQADHWGLELEKAWKSDALVLAGFRGEYPRRILHAPDPGEAFAELDRLLDGEVTRLGVDPGMLLWETRAGTAMAHQFLQWADGLGATTMATLVGDLKESPGPSTEWVLQRATGVFHLARLAGGLHELAIYRIHPPLESTGPITLELMPGAGFVAPTGRIGRRRGDTAAAAEDRLLLMRLAAGPPPDVEGWLRRTYTVTEAKDPLEMVSRLQGEPFGMLCISIDRARTEEALQICQTVRPMTSAALVLVSGERLRSVDRARAIEAGADDVLTNEVNIREMESRIRRAATCAGERPRAVDQDGGSIRTPDPVDELLSRKAFAAIVNERLASKEFGFFTFVGLAGALPQGTSEALRESIRVEAGDVVGALDDGFGIVLQEARAGHAEGFLGRVRAALAEQLGEGVELETEILASPDDAERIRALLPG
jgi:CheY-like chemotaxis protein